MTKLRLLLAMALAAGFACIGPAWAQDWPSRPVTLMVAFPAGGSDDILGRIVAARLSELLRQPVNVENIAGAGGMTGTSRVAKAAPDGYQIALGTSATHAVSQVARKTPLYHCAQGFAGRRPAGVHRLRQGERDEDAIWFGRRGIGDPPRVRAARHRDRHQGQARAL
jgi:hypothetical protein